MFCRVSQSNWLEHREKLIDWLIQLSKVSFEWSFNSSYMNFMKMGKKMS